MEKSHTIWAVKSAGKLDTQYIAELLDDLWEPFAVDQWVMYFRKRVLAS